VAKQKASNEASCQYISNSYFDEKLRFAQTFLGHWSEELIVHFPCKCYTVNQCVGHQWRHQNTALLHLRQAAITLPRQDHTRTVTRLSRAATFPRLAFPLQNPLPELAERSPILHFPHVSPSLIYKILKRFDRPAVASWYLGWRCKLASQKDKNCTSSKTSGPNWHANTYSRGVCQRWIR